MPSLAELTDNYTNDPVDKQNAISIRSLTDAAQPVQRIYVSPMRETQYTPSVITDPTSNNSGDIAPSSQSEQPVLDRIINRLTGSNGVERYQTWPEKLVRSGVSAAGDALAGNIPSNLGLRREDVTDIPAPTMPTNDSTWLGKALNIAPVSASPQDQMIERALDMSAVAGTGGLAGTTDATLGATPFLRPA